MDLLEDLVDPNVSVVAACAALGVSRATLYRATCPPAPPTLRERAPSPRRLSDDERQAIVDLMHTPEFVDQPPMEMFAKLLSQGVYLASIRTIYRVLAELGESKERRNQRLPHRYVKPSLTATGPNQVWTWDITKLATLQKGIFLHAYVIIDLFSRYVVGWMVAAKERKHLAAQLFADTIARHGIEPGLVVHSDRGAAMKSDTLAQLLATLGVDQSFSRPRVSDDNPFSEAQFKTLKYQPDYPERFTGVLHARGWLEPFFRWHNDDHHHSSLALFTPAQVFLGRVAVVHAVRQEALDAAYVLHPQRFPNGPPKAALPPAEVHINPLEAGVISIGQAHVETLGLATIHAAPIDDPLCASPRARVELTARPAPGAVLAVGPHTRARGACSVTGAEAPTLH
jgi:transposase InsO family protein